jgi:hypothetical protein
MSGYEMKKVKSRSMRRRRYYHEERIMGAERQSVSRAKVVSARRLLLWPLSNLVPEVRSVCLPSPSFVLAHNATFFFACTTCLSSKDSLVLHLQIEIRTSWRRCDMRRELTGKS